jgi:hypothetical protein
MLRANQAMARALEDQTAQLGGVGVNARIAAGVRARLAALEPYSRAWPQVL